MINELCAFDYCCDDISLIENYEKAINDTTQMWECHHRLEEKGYDRTTLRKMKKYFQVPASDLIFLTPSEHRKIHSKINGVWNKGKKGCYSEDTIQKMRESHKGNTATLNKHWTLSEESKKNISEGVKKSVEAGRKKQKPWKWDEEKRKKYVPWNKGLKIKQSNI